MYRVFLASPEEIKVLLARNVFKEKLAQDYIMDCHVNAFATLERLHERKSNDNIAADECSNIEGVHETLLSDDKVYLLMPINREEMERSLKDSDQYTRENKTEFSKIKRNDPVLFLKEMIHRWYMKDLSIAALAEELGYNPSYLGRSFKTVVGISFIQYLTNKRVEIAKQILENTNWRLKQIAQSIGYSDDKYFIKVFKKQTGFSPAEFREAKKREKG
ncbi:helix-turn-helix transcriptional regulator [Bacillaceae bacterium SIJ1]|uniref:helix-turn-helix domain-containing protein n=1 Tax=Litoribacterium kuwaitense TaxID=1398745 RepID=UPI0013EC2FA5|nr:helix-turn-helix transcriptional regulator [Litoribacterium kuwaitense]NGP46023.1 helix-turn-helix transcriptional regulator [Litoribacterium kuwaitense]